MSPTAAFAPLFVQVALTFALLFHMGRLRIRMVRDGTVATRDIALGQPAWPPLATQAANAFRSQFELPVLFYLVIVLAFLAGRMTDVLVVLSWAFVVTRLLHALVHVTTNNVPRRFWAYTAGLIILMAMWVDFLVSLVAAP
jgi:hypothetical protein